MSDHQQDHQKITGDITIDGSVIGMGIAIGHNNVVQVTQVYAWARAQPADPQTVEAARALLAQLPTDAIPNLATLPPGSRTPNRIATFVGRELDLLRIAAALRDGQTAVINQAAPVHGLCGVGKSTGGCRVLITSRRGVWEIAWG